MHDCSLITATYHVDGKLVGKIGVIGPTRMKYGCLLYTSKKIGQKD